jgi:uncharacterized RDD family membrane protein YckC
MYCSHCGAANPDGGEVRFCRACGKEMPQATLAPAFGQPYQTPSLQAQTPELQAAVPGAALNANSGLAAPVSPMQAALFPYGGFWIRLVAYIIDWVITSFAGGVVGFVLGFAAAFSRGSSTSAELMAGLLAFALSFLYFLILPPTLGATVGKLILGYHIVGADGRHIGFGTSFVRMIGQLISGIALVLGYVWIGIDAYKQGWHDKIANTYVVRREFVQP